MSTAWPLGPTLPATEPVAAVRLKEMEAYKELAGKVGQVNLVLGMDAVPQLQLKT